MKYSVMVSCFVFVMWIVAAFIVGAGFGAWAHKISCLYRRSSPRCDVSDNRQQRLDEAVDTVLRLSDELKLANNLRYEQAVKNKLLEEFRIIFAYEDLKDPEFVLQRLQAHLKQEEKNSSDHGERRKTAETLRALINDVRRMQTVGK